MFGTTAGPVGLTSAACALLIFSSIANASPPIPEPRPEYPESPKKADQPVYTRYSNEVACLAQAVYFEARGEPLVGQKRVAQVVVNRTDNPYYPATICEVVYQNDHRPNACQFSFACDGIPDRIKEPAAFLTARRIAAEALECDAKCRMLKDLPERSTHYHADWVTPSWASRLARTGKIGRHIFYFSSSM